jgi:hypothetical protein
MNAEIIYAGDTRLTAAASYLAGVLTHAGLRFDYVASDEPLRPRLQQAEPRLYIISDYPVKNLCPADFERLTGDVDRGAGLLMIGGWESFCGVEGEYAGTPLEGVLPVVMQPKDDRVNSWQPCLVEKRCEHPIVDGLPLDRPPGVGGYNLVRPKGEATEVLAARHVAVEIECNDEVEPFACRYTFTRGEAAPLLVVGGFGDGRTAAFTSDVAPHWVGGLVDWGDRRVKARAPGANDIEVGNWYAEFFTRLVRWTMGDL